MGSFIYYVPEEVLVGIYYVLGTMLRTCIILLQSRTNLWRDSSCFYPHLQIRKGQLRGVE